MGCENLCQIFGSRITIPFFGQTRPRNAASEAVENTRRRTGEGRHSRTPIPTAMATDRPTVASATGCE